MCILAESRRALSRVDVARLCRARSSAREPLFRTDKNERLEIFPVAPRGRRFGALQQFAWIKSIPIRLARLFAQRIRRVCVSSVLRGESKRRSNIHHSHDFPHSFFRDATRHLAR